MTLITLIMLIALIVKINKLQKTAATASAAAPAASSGKDLQRVVIGKSALEGTVIWMEGDEPTIIKGLLAIKINPKHIYIA